MADGRYDAIIIGAGVIGACVALELARGGRRTLSVDRNPQAGYGSTSGSCAIIRTYYSALESCAIACEGWYDWMDWPGYLGHDDPRGMIRYNNTGSMVVKTAHNGHLKTITALMDLLDCPYEELTADQMRARLPIMDTRSFGPPKRPDDADFGEPAADAVDGAVYFPRSGYVSDPAQAARNAEHAARQHGATFLYNAAVTAVRRADGRVAGITLADGRSFDAPVVINVGGPHSAVLNRMAGVYDAMRMKTRPLRHEVAHVPAPPGFDFEKDGMVYSDSDVGTYARPELGNHILIGSEDPACDTKDWVDDPDDFNREFTEQWRTQALRLAQRFPEMPIPSRMKGVVELYDVTEDWIPIYDRTDLPGFYVAIGTSGNQFKNAPVAGRMMKAIVDACEGGQDHDTDPVQFHLPRVGRTIGLGFFSRNREVNPNSSFSVLG